MCLRVLMKKINPKEEEILYVHSATLEQILFRLIGHDMADKPFRQRGSAAFVPTQATSIQPMGVFMAQSSASKELRTDIDMLV